MTSKSDPVPSSILLSKESSVVVVVEEKKSAWDIALEGLTPEDRESIGALEKINSLAQIKLAAEKQRDLCIAKRERWRIGRVVLWDVLDKVVIWIDKFIEVGDVIAQYDPAHAALPWACIRLILRITVNGTKTFGSVLEGLEHISNLIGRCALIECIYLDNSLLKSHKELVKLLIGLYITVLKYLAKAMWYFNRGFAGVLTSSDVFESKLQDVIDKELEIDKFAQFVLVEKHQANHREILIKLREPIDSIRMIRTYFEDAERWKILDWISNVPFNQHHSNIREDRLPHSGEWLLQKKVYKNWREDSSCSILWLHGMPGSGKSKLVSLVVDNLRPKASGRSEPIAFFYCVRTTSESARGNADEILRCLLRQLLSFGPSLPVMESVMNTYNDLQKEGLRKLTFNETKQLIIDLTEIYPAITIIIDALEECDSRTRWKLLDALEDIAAESARLVKIFLSSRTHEDIASRLRRWTELSIGETDNAKDIESLIHYQVEQAISSGRLLHGERISDELNRHLVATLTKGARGMFQWVTLQLQSLCSGKMKHEDDIRHELRQLPIELKDIYSIIYNKISDLPPQSHSTAMRVLQWLLCSQRQLSTEEFLAAVSLDSKGAITKISTQQVLGMCCNFVVLDKALNVFRFAHFSIQEYLESRPEHSSAAAHTLAAETCLAFLVKRHDLTSLTAESNDIFKGYATLFWATHCQMSGGCGHSGTLKELLQCFASPDIGGNLAFERWAASALTHLESIAWDNPFKAKFESMLSVPANPVFASCVWGFEDLIQHCEASGKGDVRRLNIRKFSALHIASQYGHPGIVRLLLQMGLDFDAESGYGSTALHLAAQAGNETVVQLLIDKGASIQARDRNHWTALHYACKGGSKAVSQLLIKENVDVKAVDKSKRTALHQAAEIGNEEIVKLILQGGAEIEAKDEEGRTPLYEAAERGHEKVVSLLLSHTADIDAKDKGGWMALGRAVVKDYQAVVCLLLSRGANIQGRSGNWTALHWTAQKGNEALARLLLDHGADVTARDGWGKTPLHRVAGTGHGAVALQLLDKGAEIDAIDVNGCTALGCAAEEGDTIIVQLLLEQKASILITNNDGKMPLHQAAARGHDNVVQVLLHKGADIQAGDNDEKSALYHAAMGGHFAVVQTLLKNGAEDVVEKGGKLALHVAAEKGHGRIVRQLLQSSLCLERGDIHVQDDYYGMTPTHWAAKEGHMEIVKLLLDGGADPSIEDWEGLTVWDWINEDSEELSALLAAV